MNKLAMKKFNFNIVYDDIEQMVFYIPKHNYNRTQLVLRRPMNCDNYYISNTDILKSKRINIFDYKQRNYYMSNYNQFADAPYTIIWI